MEGVGGFGQGIGREISAADLFPHRQSRGQVMTFIRGARIECCGPS